MSPSFPQQTNPLQHAPRGEVPAGMHETYWSDGGWRDSRRLALYKHFLRPGDLAFDVGANIGEVTRVLLAMGCRVVSVEPQMSVAQFIDNRAEVFLGACGSSAGRSVFYETASNPPLSTMRRQIADFNESTNPAWTSQEVEVEVTTLDALIAEHGLPGFVKIDVEGFEVEVLQGLTQPLPALSFEVHSFDQSKIGACIAKLDSLGDYGYLYSPGESYELGLFPPDRYAWFGDVYATLRSRQVDQEALIADSRPPRSPPA